MDPTGACRRVLLAMVVSARESGRLSPATIRTLTTEEVVLMAEVLASNRNERTAEALLDLFVELDERRALNRGEEDWRKWPAREVL